MTQTVKKAIKTLESLNPYTNRSPEREEAYLALWKAMRTLRKLDIISTDDWDAIFIQDSKMYKDAE